MHGSEQLGGTEIQTGFCFCFSFFLSNMRCEFSPGSLVSKHVELDSVLVLVSVLEEN